MTTNTLVHAAVGRTGLGNMLFSWARAEVFRHRFGAPMLAPQWTQPKIGPLLRRETDLRYYTGLFENRDYIRGPGRMLAMLRRRIDGDSIGIDANPAQVASSIDGALVVFQGYQGWFRDDLHRHRELVRNRLEAIVSDRVRSEIQSFDAPLQIAMHVRRGDMSNLIPAGEEFRGLSPVESEYFYVSVLRRIREAAGHSIPATIFTDARPGELKDLLKEKEVHLAPPCSAIAHLLLMSRASALVTSSSSSFSTWASYLGAMPTVWHRGQVRRLLPAQPELAIESDPHGAIAEGELDFLLARLTPANAGAER
jgi:hypothetical protein